MKAKDLLLPTYEASVSCGAYCQGGSVNMQPTTYPEFTDAEEVWVKGDDVAALAARLAEADALLDGVIGLIDWNDLADPGADPVSDLCRKIRSFRIPDSASHREDGSHGRV